jgi:hypothetical protein
MLKTHTRGGKLKPELGNPGCKNLNIFLKSTIFDA